MTERVGNEISDLVAAIAPVAGPIVNDERTVLPPSPAHPSQPFPPISVQLWEGTKDQNLWPCGYGQTNYSGVIFTVDSADDTINYWTGPNTNACTTFQTSETLCANGAPNNANDAPTPGVPGDTGNIATVCSQGNVRSQIHLGTGCGAQRAGADRRQPLALLRRSSEAVGEIAGSQVLRFSRPDNSTAAWSLGFFLGKRYGGGTNSTNRVWD